MRLGRLSNLGLQNAFHTSSQTAGSVERRHDKAVLPGLDAYFEEKLQISQASGEGEAEADADAEAEAEDKEWVQFQFPKRIEWKPTPASILLGNDAKSLATEGDKSIQQDGDAIVTQGAEAALAHIDAAIEREIEGPSPNFFGKLLGEFWRDGGSPPENPSCAAPISRASRNTLIHCSVLSSLPCSAKSSGFEQYGHCNGQR